MPDVRDNAAMRRFEMVSGGTFAYVEYRRTGQWVNLVHAEVPASLTGHGIGSTLVRSVLDHLRAEGAKVIPTCEFVAAYLKQHPEYRDLLPERR